MNRTIELKLSITKRRMLLLNDLLTAVILLLAGFEVMDNGNNILLALVNISSGAALLFVGIREWRSMTKLFHSRVQWLDVVSGLVMMINTGIMYKPWKGFQPAYIYGLLSIFLILKGFSIIRTPNTRKLIISERDFYIKAGMYKRLKCKWDEVESFSLENKTIVVAAKNGSMKVSLRNIENKEEAYEALVTALQSVKK